MSLLLTGIAINAICLSSTGFMSYIARDPQARSITFWNLGHFFRSKLDAGFYYRHRRGNYFYCITPLFKTIKCFITGRRRGRLFGRTYQKIKAQYHVVKYSDGFNSYCLCWRD
jgi:hypothetical protein